MKEKILELMSLPTAWDCGRKDRLDWKCLVKLSRPGWWLVHVWLYLAPTGQKYHLLSSLSFWLGLAYVLFPLNLLVYGLNDYTDVELDAKNARKGNFMYGAKCSAEQLKDLPRMIVILNVVPIIILALVSGQWLALSIWLPTCFAVNLAYNVEPLRLSSKGPFELPCVVFGFAGVTALASIVNNLGWAPIGYWAHMSCLVLRTQIWTEFLDYDPDAACGRRTTSTLLGKDLSKALVVILLALEGLVTWLAKPLPLTKNDLVVGDFDWTRIALRQLGCPMPPPPDYPKCLQHLLYRKIWSSTLGEVREELKAMPDRQVFIKPAVETKAFSAIVEPKDQMLNTLLDGIPGALDPLPSSMRVHCAEVVDLIAEYRVYVVHGEVRAICHYKGPASPPLDEQVVHEAVRTLWKSEEGQDLTGMAMDFAVMRDKAVDGDSTLKTCLVEVNDGYSLGVYPGLSGKDYTDLLIARWQRLTTGVP
ncbi:Lycopene elongase/hydratase [Durusdinium trenchii]|uniref:Lycopene elongase/hydratase n=1 Tax=Durusdinium trenchii TaxID=1381693 RepID=A0ABP0IZU8_9DINO